MLKYVLKGAVPWTEWSSCSCTGEPLRLTRGGFLWPLFMYALHTLEWAKSALRSRLCVSLFVALFKIGPEGHCYYYCYFYFRSCSSCSFGFCFIIFILNILLFLIIFYSNSYYNSYCYCCFIVAVMQQVHRITLLRLWRKIQLLPMVRWWHSCSFVVCWCQRLWRGVRNAFGMSLKSFPVFSCFPTVSLAA
jgi:hypothetical protein